MVNKLKRNALLSIVAEWLEEAQLPLIVPRNNLDIKPEDLLRILAIVGPRRAGKTYFMYQLVQSLLQDGQYTKENILFIDFEDFRLAGLSSEGIDEIFSVFYQLTGKYPDFSFSMKCKTFLTGAVCFAHYTTDVGSRSLFQGAIQSS